MAVLVAGAVAIDRACAAELCWDPLDVAPPWYRIHRGSLALVAVAGEWRLTTVAPRFFECDSVPVPAPEYCTGSRCCAEVLDLAGFTLAAEFVTAFDPDLPGSESRNGGLLDAVQSCP